VVVVIVGELRGVEKVRPIILLVVAEYSQVGADPFIVVFHLSLGLWVVWRRESLVDSQSLKEASGVFGSEQGPLSVLWIFGTPWSLHTCVRCRCARSSAFARLVVGIRWAILVSLSMTT
jgi:hypothetical protein